MRLVTIVLLASTLIRLDGADAPLIDRIRQRSAETVRMRIPFSMEKHLALLDEPIESKGVLEIDRERHAVRWEFTGELVVIYADDRLRRWDGRGREEPVDPSRDPGAATMRGKMKAFLSGDWSGMDQMFDISEGEGTSLVMQPKDRHLAKFVRRLEIAFDPETLAPVRVEIANPSGDRTIYRFAAAEPGATIPAERFRGP